MSSAHPDAARRAAGATPARVRPAARRGAPGRPDGSRPPGRLLQAARPHRRALSCPGPPGLSGDPSALPPSRALDGVARRRRAGARRRRGAARRHGPPDPGAGETLLVAPTARAPRPAWSPQVVAGRLVRCGSRTVDRRRAPPCPRWCSCRRSRRAAGTSWPSRRPPSSASTPSCPGRPPAASWSGRASAASGPAAVGADGACRREAGPAPARPRVRPTLTHAATSRRPPPRHRAGPARGRGPAAGAGSGAGRRRTVCVVVVGPEGGVAPEELAELTGAGAVAVRLGPAGAALVVGRARPRSRCSRYALGRWGPPPATSP